MPMDGMCNASQGVFLWPGSPWLAGGSLFAIPQKAVTTWLATDTPFTVQLATSLESLDRTYLKAASCFNFRFVGALHPTH